MLAGAIAALTLAVVAVGGVLLVDSSSGDGDPGARRQESVAARGSRVMPFALEETTHHFTPTDDGGIQAVVADTPGDAEQVVLIREHLSEEVERFREGDFGDPEAIHGHDMPGLEVLRARADSLDISSREVPEGAEITYRASDPKVVRALHAWFAAQLSDHGAHASAGQHSG